MDKLNWLVAGSVWWLPVCIAVGLLYAYALYQAQSPWSAAWNYALAAMRATVVAIICILLLLNPILRQIVNREEKPAVVLAIDNSQSVSNIHDKAYLDKLYANLEALKRDLQAQDLAVEVQTLALNEPNNSNLPALPRNLPATPLSAMLSTIQNNYENRYLSKVLLISDGIYNQGSNPLNLSLNMPVYSLALGDTTPKRDIRIASVLANKVAYLGNEFPIVAEIENVGFPNRTLTVYLQQGGRVLAQKQVSFGGDGSTQSVSFYTQAKQKGIQHLTIAVDVLQGEFTQQNNTREVFVEVIDGREKILIVAAAPHPDIKALRAAIEKQENYQVSLHIPGITQLPSEKFDLVIFHQVPSIFRVGNELLAQFKEAARWFIVGAQSDLAEFNKISKQLKISARGGRVDQVTPIYNKSFGRFGLSGNKSALVGKLPPVSVPFAEYALGNRAEVLLWQRVGNLATEKPLLVIDQDGTQKTAILAGEGIWHWRLEEFSMENSHEATDELISKIVQFLSTKEDKRKLRVYPINNEFYDFEKVVFESEVYNELYERVYGQRINLALTDAQGTTKTYNFTSAEGNTRYALSGLAPGVYRYTASADLRGNTERVSGEFTVRNLQLEALNTTADHNLLRQLSERTGGQFFAASQYEEFRKAVLAKRPPNRLHSTEDVSEAINLWWIFFLLVSLLAAEWGLRKYQGSY